MSTKPRHSRADSPAGTSGLAECALLVLAIIISAAATSGIARPCLIAVLGASLCFRARSTFSRRQKDAVPAEGERMEEPSHAPAPQPGREDVDRDHGAPASPQASMAAGPGAPVAQAAAASPSPEPSGPRPPEQAALEPTDLDEATFDYERFAARLMASDDPLDELKLFARDVRRRRQHRDERFPSPFERFVARELTEAGLFADDVELPRFSVVRPPASGMLYLRIRSRELPYLALSRILGIESALNAARLSATYFDDPNEHTIVEHYQLQQRLARSICAQSPNLDEHVPVIEDEHPDSEWAVRLGISTAIESLQLPHRLEASFRANVADGNVALRIELPPEGAFAGSTYVDGMGLVPTTRDMRHHASADYALRLALLVAACAFRCSEKILHVWVQATQETAIRHACYLAVDFDRWRFSQLDLANLGDLSETYRHFAATFRLEQGALKPIAATFSLEESRFCPPRRYVPVSLSPRRLRGAYAEALGTNHVAGLAIEEATNRELVASGIMRSVGPTTEENVRAILNLAGDDPDPTVRSAAERCVRKLIDGALESDATAIGMEFVRGDDLSAAVRKANSALQSRQLAEARRLLESVLSPIDRAGLFSDSATIEYRHFSSYVDRALYNRFFALPGHTALLVPDSYYEAHLLLSAAYLLEGNGAEALVHARRLVEVAPLDTRARLHLVRCLEVSGQASEAIEALKELLLIAHDAEGLGMGYYRMAFFQWQMGNFLAAQACYLRAMRVFPASTPMVAVELAVLSLQSPGTVREDLSDEEIESLFQEHGIPVAPTDQMSEAFVQCARAAVDAEIFPVARNFVQVLSAFSHDDILMGLIRSIEDAPDV